MKYYSCTDCGIEKTGSTQRSARCKSCSKKGNTAWTRGKLRGPQSPNHRKNVSLGKGGCGDVENRLYSGIGRWTRLVKERDGCCTMCGTVKELEAHHIVPKATRPDLCAVLENGITLCIGCHRTEPWAIHKQENNICHL